MTEIIDVDFKPKPVGEIDEPELRIRRRHELKCQHRRTTVDEVTRSVECRDCGATLDATEILLEWAREWNKRWANATTLLRERDRLKKEIEDLKRQRRNIKAQIARARIPS
jgi:hypothetical protein